MARLKNKTIRGLSDIYHKYDTFYGDLWGVVLNGIHLNSGAIDVLHNLYILNIGYSVSPPQWGD